MVKKQISPSNEGCDMNYDPFHLGAKVRGKKLDNAQHFITIGTSNRGEMSVIPLFLTIGSSKRNEKSVKPKKFPGSKFQLWWKVSDMPQVYENIESIIHAKINFVSTRFYHLYV